MWTDADALAKWMADNLDRYWCRLRDRASHLLSPWGLATLTSYGTVWVVTGVGRIHYSLATGDITSKTGAALYALDAFAPQWRRLINESLRIRRADQARPTLSSAVAGWREFAAVGRDAQRSLYPTPLARRRDVLAFTDAVIADAHRL